MPIAAGGPADRLGSWKDIAAYLQRDVSTVQRWEKREGMPVHRHLHGKLGSVYAFRSEIDAWWENRSVVLGEQDQAPEDVGKPSRASWTRWLGIAALAALVVAAVTFVLDDTRTAGPQPPTIRSLAVLPLTNLSADASQEYFALGMTDELIGALARISALRVVSRTSAMSLNGSNKSLPALARELKGQQVDAALLIPLCPVCHQSIALVARHLESEGISTVCLVSALDIVQSVNPPRAAFLDYPLGHTAGRPGDPAEQYAVTRQAVACLETITTPRSIETLPFQWAQDEQWKRDLFERDAGDLRPPRDATPRYQTEEDRRLAESAL